MLLNKAELQRIAALEAAVHTLQANLAEVHGALAAEREQRAHDAGVLAELGGRLALLEQRMPEAAARQAHEDLGQLRLALTRLERQRAVDAEETRKIAAGLLQRIEQGRTADAETATPLQSG